MIRFFHSLTFRLTLLYSVYFCLLIVVSLYSFHYFHVESPTDSIKDQLHREAAELSAIYERGGIVAASRALEARRHKEAERYPFDALIDAQSAVVTSNLPSWPASSTQDWLRTEADLHPAERTRVVKGKSVSVRVDLGGGRTI